MILFIRHTQIRAFVNALTDKWIIRITTELTHTSIHMHLHTCTFVISTRKVEIESSPSSRPRYRCNKHLSWFLTQPTLITRPSSIWRITYQIHGLTHIQVIDHINSVYHVWKHYVLSTLVHHSCRLHSENALPTWCLVREWGWMSILIGKEYYESATSKVVAQCKNYITWSKFVFVLSYFKISILLWWMRRGD